MEECIICFKKINRKCIFGLLLRPCICQDCYLKMDLKPRSIKINKISVLSLFPYNDFIKSMIYQLKGCNDIVLAKAFLSYDKLFLKLKYHDYNLVFVPSYITKDEIRGFNHVKEIFKHLNLKSIDILKKTSDVKQSSLNKLERGNISNFIDKKKYIDLSKEKILLVDDIITTGSTIRRCIEILNELNAKKIKVLTIAYSLSKNG